MDGQVLKDIFTESFQETVQIRDQLPQSATSIPTVTDLSGQEEDEILERLRGLGYVD
jgi:hypothetical protein